jgi:GNAT superfamily N-acetyltransferase
MTAEPTPHLLFQHFTEPDYESIAMTLLDVYEEVYQKVIAEPFNTVAEFYRRLCGYSATPGWECVLASHDDQPVGYAFGHPLPADSTWWRGLLTTVPPGDIREDGFRTFALNEIMVRHPWRGTGAARAIHDEPINRRPEERATLLVEQALPRVRRRYEQWGYKWGYTWLATLQPDIPHAPTFDALVLPRHT